MLGWVMNAGNEGAQGCSVNLLPGVRHLHALGLKWKEGVLQHLQGPQTSVHASAAATAPKHARLHPARVSNRQPVACASGMHRPCKYAFSVLHRPGSLDWVRS